MSTLNEYQVRCFDGDGATIATMSLTAENLIDAARRAAELASEVNAADFTLSPVSPHHH